VNKNLTHLCEKKMFFIHHLLKSFGKFGMLHANYMQHKKLKSYASKCKTGCI